MKNKVLPLSYNLANLPVEELDKLEDPDSLYNSGWSYGKEQLKPNKVDKSKGSFYFNPLVDIPGTEEDRTKYPISYPINKWPSSNSESCNAVSELEPTCKEIGTLMKNVAVLVAYYIDQYVASKKSTTSTNDTISDTDVSLYDLLKDTIKVKGRLLYYYPLSKAAQEGAEKQEHGTGAGDVLATNGIDEKKEETEKEVESDVEDSWIGWRKSSPH